MRCGGTTAGLGWAALGVLALTFGGCSPPDGGTSDSTRASRAAVVDEYFGVKVGDPYRWLENDADPAVREWSLEQTERTRRFLEGLPSIDRIRARLTDLMASRSVSYGGLRWAGGRIFAMKEQPPLEQPMLVVMDSADALASENVLVDPNKLDPAGTTAIDFFEPSFDGNLVAVSISKGGSEAGDVHLYDVTSRRALEEVIPRVNGGTAGGSLAWSGDGTGFYYTRYPRAGERPETDLAFYQQIYFHRLGDATASDRYEIGKDFPRIAEIQIQSSRDGKYVLASVQNGDGGEFTHHLRRPDGSWTEITRYEDGCVLATLGSDDTIYLVSRLGAPRGKVLRLPLGGIEPSLKDAITIVPEGPDAVTTDFASNSGLAAGRTRLFVRYQQGGPSAVKIFGLSGKPEGQLPAPPVATVAGVTLLDGEDALYRVQTFLSPPAWYQWRAADSSSHRTRLAETSPADFSDTEVVREEAVSKDGTRIPISILRRKGTRLDGSNPTLLTGYGGYGFSEGPRFNPSLRAWIEQGGVYALANIRGGGEFGEEWHRAGSLTRKQNVFDDFAAAARHLADAGYTRPERSAAIGGSNGGLLMGAMITQHPDRFRAIVSFVGIYDMLRVELTPNGAFNVTEFGSVRDPEQFRALHAYSPYHHVADGTRYPAILMLTGENDPRVAPWQSRKMVARLQEATSSGLPVLLRTSGSSGHGIGTALGERIAEMVAVDAFLFHELGVTYQPVRR